MVVLFQNIAFILVAHDELLNMDSWAVDVGRAEGLNRNTSILQFSTLRAVYSRHKKWPSLTQAIFFKALPHP
jgi:hypothetical protein